MHVDGFSIRKCRRRHPSHEGHVLEDRDQLAEQPQRNSAHSGNPLLETEYRSIGKRTRANLWTIEHDTLKIRMKLQQGVKHCAPAPPISATVLTPLVLISLAVSFAAVDVKLVIDSVKAAASAAFVAKYSNSPAPSAGTAWLFPVLTASAKVPRAANAQVKARTLQ
jgi:hypothetical protein